MVGLETYGLQNLYKGKVLKKLADDKLLVYIPDLILSKPHAEPMQESINSINIVNSKDLQLTNSLKSVNGIICKPLYINEIISIPEVGNTVFVVMIDGDPKKIFYMNITNERPIKKESKNVENSTTIKISSDSIVKEVSSNVIEITGKVYIEWKGDEDLCGKLKSSEE